MLFKIFNANRVGIIFTYIVLLIECGIYGIFPWVAGLALDGIMSGAWGIFYWYIIICISALLIGVSRRMIDTRVYANIWSRAAKETVGRLLGIGAAKVISRAGLVERYISFYELILPNSVSSLVETMISFVMIYLAIGHSAWWILLCMVVGMVGSYYFSCLAKHVESAAQGIRESINHDIESGVIPNYGELSERMVEQSDIEAMNWGLMDLCRIVAEVILIVVLMQSEVTVGLVMSSVTYCWRIFQHSEMLYYFLANWKEIEVANEYLERDI